MRGIRLAALKHVVVIDTGPLANPWQYCPRAAFPAPWDGVGTLHAGDDMGRYMAGSGRCRLLWAVAQSHKGQRRDPAGGRQIYKNGRLQLVPLFKAAPEGYGRLCGLAEAAAARALPRERPGSNRGGGKKDRERQAVRHVPLCRARRAPDGVQRGRAGPGGGRASVRQERGRGILRRGRQRTLPVPADPPPPRTHVAEHPGSTA